MKILITCEHASNALPDEWQHILTDDKAILATHRGWDLGAADLARSFASEFSTTPILGQHSRLLIDLNRSPDQGELFSEYVEGLSPADRARIIENYHRPYWDEVDQLISNADERIIHLSVHSFTPIWQGCPRSTEVGILYRTDRPVEAAFGERWANSLRSACPDLEVHLNQPYTGDQDGLVNVLCERYPSDHYIGLELEVRQDLLEPAKGDTLTADLIESFRRALPG